jgi:hypothetical protein
MPKNTNFIQSCMLIFIITLSFVGVPYIVNNIPDDLLSIPNKDYWLSTDNQERLIKIISKYMYSIGLAINIFMIFIFHQIYRFNIHAVNNVSLIGIVPLLIIILGFTIHLLVHLNKCV